jgi:hypothetical protein
VKEGAMAARLPLVPAGRLLDFRRRGAPVRRRRRSPLLGLVRPLAIALSAVALPLGLSAWVVSSRRFALRDIVVTPGTRVDPASIRAVLEPLEGKNLPLLSLAETEGRLRGLPWVENAELRKELPQRLLVTLSERRPVVLIAGTGGLWFADAAGRPIAPLTSPAEATAARQQGLLEVSLAPAADPVAGISGALEVTRELRQVHPDWASALNLLDVLGEDDFRLHSSTLPCPVLVNRGRLVAQLRRLEELVPLLSRHYPKLAGIDLRFTRRIVVQPLNSPVPQHGAGAS